MIKQLSDLLDKIRYEQLASETVDKTKLAVLNFLGGSLPGAYKPLTLAEKKVWEMQGCRGEAVLLGHTGTTSAVAAAAVNGAMGEIYLSEDIHMPTSTHPGMMVIPVSMAVAQEVHAGGKKVIEAIVAGYEAMGRIGAGLLGPDFARNGKRPASILAPFGGAVAAVKVMGLGADAIERAIALAGNTSAGVMEFVHTGTADICIQNCFAAKNAVMAAMLAAEGIEAAPTILDGRFGLGMALTDQNFSWEKVFQAPDHELIIDHTSVKAFPGCAYVQATAQAAMALIKEHPVQAGDVRRITAGVCRASEEWPGVDFQGPFTGTIQALMSHQYMIAAAVIHKRIDTEVIDDYENPDIAKLAKLIYVETDDELERNAPEKQGAKIVIELKDGRILEHTEHQVTPMSKEEITDRFRIGAKPYFSKNRQEEILKNVWEMENITSINSLMNLLQPNV